MHLSCTTVRFLSSDMRPSMKMQSMEPLSRFIRPSIGDQTAHMCCPNLTISGGTNLMALHPLLTVLSKPVLAAPNTVLTPLLRQDHRFPHTLKWDQLNLHGQCGVMVRVGSTLVLTVHHQMTTNWRWRQRRALKM